MWTIATDSSCDHLFRDIKNETIIVRTIPFHIRVGGREYTDDENLDTISLVEAMENCPTAGQTSCPSPGAWQEAFMEAEQTIAITISEALSGSYSSALAARQMVLEEYPDKKIYILNSKSAGSGLSILAEKLIELIERGDQFEEIVDYMQGYTEEIKTVFALSSFTNLIKNGRMSKLSGFIAGKLDIWAIGRASKEGRIAIVGKKRGKNSVISSIVDMITSNHFTKGKIYISHCHNKVMAERLKREIMARWTHVDVFITETRGLCSYYAERGGMIVSYACGTA